MKRSNEANQDNEDRCRCKRTRCKVCKKTLSASGFVKQAPYLSFSHLCALGIFCVCAFAGGEDRTVVCAAARRLVISLSLSKIKIVACLQELERMLMVKIHTPNPGILLPPSVALRQLYRLIVCTRTAPSLGPVPAPVSPLQCIL